MSNAAGTIRPRSHPEAPAYNNAAERSSRPPVVSRKVNGATHPHQGTETKMTPASILPTWRAQCLNTLTACERLLASPQSATVTKNTGGSVPAAGLMIPGVSPLPGPVAVEIRGVFRTVSVAFRVGKCPLYRSVCLRAPGSSLRRGQRRGGLFSCRGVHYPDTVGTLCPQRQRWVRDDNRAGLVTLNRLCLLERQFSTSSVRTPKTERGCTKPMVPDRP